MRPIANRASAVRGANGPSSRKAVAKTCNASGHEGNSEVIGLTRPLGGKCAQSFNVHYALVLVDAEGKVANPVVSEWGGFDN